MRISVLNGLVLGLISFLVCMPARAEDDLSSFVGVWASIDRPGAYLRLTQNGNSIEGSFPSIGPGFISGAGGSNVQVSGTGFSCFYFVTTIDHLGEMKWKLTGGPRACPISAHFKFVATELTPTPYNTTAWTQNGSDLTMISDGDRVDFYYELPNAEVRGAGGTTGTLKFTGRRIESTDPSKGAYYSGLAFVYTKYCLGIPFGYRVTGTENADGTVIKLRGPAPRVDPRRCEIHDLGGESGRYLEFHRVPNTDTSSTRRRRTG